MVESLEHLAEHRIILEPSYYQGSQWRPLIESYWPAELVDTALCLVEKESGGNPSAKNPVSSARGLFQILASTWAPVFGVSYQDLYDPDLNVRLAYQIYLRQGFRAWQPYVRGLCH